MTTEAPTRAELEKAHVRLVEIVNIDGPTALATRPGDDTLFIGQREGRVWALRDGQLGQEPVLDISSDVATNFDRGLFGLAFSPDGSWLYVDFIDNSTAERVVAWPYRSEKMDPDAGREIITIPQPGVIHHGGDIAFGPDGNLWIATGDSQLEEDSESATVSQSLNSLLGKLLRIEPTPTRRRPYRIPSDNPFVRHRRARPEVYAYGLRNPWRFSFDRATGDLWIGDVGRYHMEEVDFLPAGHQGGANFGWNRMEGTLPLGDEPLHHSVLPLYEYPHSKGRCAVIGGYVYRGEEIPQLQGAYVYADLCKRELQATVERGGHLAFTQSLGASLGGIWSFGEGPDGELYALSPGSISRLQSQTQP